MAALKYIFSMGIKIKFAAVTSFYLIVTDRWINGQLTDKLWLTDTLHDDNKLSYYWHTSAVFKPLD